jgi:hypothetical protein
MVCGCCTFPLTRATVTKSRHNLLLDDVDVAVGEVSEFKAAGGGTMVEATTSGIAPSPARVQEVARRTGVNVVMVGSPSAAVVDLSAGRRLLRGMLFPRVRRLTSLALSRQAHVHPPDMHAPYAVLRLTFAVASGTRAVWIVWLHRCSRTSRPASALPASVRYPFGP